MPGPAERRGLSRFWGRRYPFAPSRVPGGDARVSWQDEATGRPHGGNRCYDAGMRPAPRGQKRHQTRDPACLPVTALGASAMIIYPTLEIMDGKCVSLTRGRLDAPVLWHVDPVETARGFARAGAEWMHLTDMDGLKGGDANTDLIEEIIRAAGIPVQLGGGFRSRDAVTGWIDRGAGRIVVGTMAVQDPDGVRELAKYHPDQIVVAVDVHQGRLMTHGWQSQSAIGAEDFIAAFESAPLAGILITDIDADIEEGDGSLGVISGSEERRVGKECGSTCRARWSPS